MERLAGNAEISFEGDLSLLRIRDLPCDSNEETDVLKRNTTWPKQDFVILPLEIETIQPIVRAMGGTIPKSILHIQIARAGKLQFGAYDRFHPDCLTFGEALDQDFVSALVRRGILDAEG